MSTPFFELRGITKYFSKVIANKDVSFSIQHGQVLALLGENGAGKSTVMKILYGLYRADEGQVLMEGREQKIHSPKDAMALGISMIQQHFSLVPAHTVAENIILGNVHGVINKKSCEASIQALSDKYGFNIRPDALVGGLTVGEQQKVEILKALYQDTRLLIMDEPTAVLTPQEADTLMEFVRGFVADGNAVVFITHKLKEVMEVADQIVVMRDGQVCGNLPRSETDEKELSRLMIGKDLVPTQLSEDGAGESQSICLSLSHVTVQPKGEVPALDDICFDIRHGEVLGIAGVSGNGQLELCEVVCGALAPTGGTVTLCGTDITGHSIRQRINNGIGYVPSDRQKDGMIMDMTLAENMMLKSSNDKRWKKYGLLSDQKRDAHTQAAIDDYNIKAPGPKAVAKGLSGGNQQKVIVAREVAGGEQLIIFDQPTRGLDLGAIDHVHKTILEQRAAGKSVLLVSTELSEIFALSDRIAVLYKGRLQGIYHRSELDTEKIGLLMAGYSIDREGAGA